MKKPLVGAVILLGIAFTSCTRQNNPDPTTQRADTISNKTTGDMKNMISIVEIPTADFPRAVAFYKAILDINIEEVDMEGVKLGLFPNSGEGVSVQLISGSDYKTSADGTVVYLNGGNDLQKVADKIKANGGKIVVPKTGIGPDMGFFAMFIDTEGNKVGLHSNK
jgi:predicted enzyme related to lactoylglutathione lyase